MEFLIALVLCVIALFALLIKAAKLSEISNEIERQAQQEPYLSEEEDD